MVVNWFLTLLLVQYVVKWEVFSMYGIYHPNSISHEQMYWSMKRSIKWQEQEKEGERMRWMDELDNENEVYIVNVEIVGKQIQQQQQTIPTTTTTC